MINTSLLARLLGVARTVTPLAPITPARLLLPQLELGQSVRARVENQQSDGGFRVAIDDTVLRLPLPAGAKPGELVTLRLIAREPQLRFELYTLSAQSPARVSGTGRFVAELVNEPAGSPPRQSQPVIATPSTEPEALRAPLARALERSGLFYEAHQARWVRGDYAIEQLLEEPQATLDARKTEPVARETLPLVRQQLETLETRQISWQGEIWPGQFMRWDIAEQEHESGDSDGGRAWLTRLNLALPALGAIGAELSLSAQGVRIGLNAQNAASAAAMQSAAGELASALKGAGLNVVALSVRQREPAF